MTDDYLERVTPVGGKQPIDRLDGYGPPAQPPAARHAGVTGTIVAVHQSAARHPGESHVLDVTVGAETWTEIVVRVPQGAYRNWEGKQAVLYLEE
ncbi:MAG: hypothetical protein HYV27_05760 [Candidatus Hydrogenedentes bacterium]|nr:hypothetical protein [Candidatus Hydrogenedentota bacterium]